MQLYTARGLRGYRCIARDPARYYLLEHVFISELLLCFYLDGALSSPAVVHMALKHTSPRATSDLPDRQVDTLSWRWLVRAPHSW